MKNLNVYEFNGDIEKALKNGEINQLIFISEINYKLQKTLSSFGEVKSIEADENFPFKQSLISFRTPFRIGPQQIRIIHLEDIIIDNKINFEKLKEALLLISRKYKYSVVGFPFDGLLAEFSIKIKEYIYSYINSGKIALIQLN